MTPPETTRTKYRWVVANITIDGTETSTEVARIAPQFVVLAPLKAYKPTLAVKSAVFVISEEANRKSCHAFANTNTAVAAMAGVTSGRSTYQKTCHRLHPSMMAASSSAVGRLSKKFLISRMPKAMLKAA